MHGDNDFSSMEFLDLLIHFTLNPEKNDIETIKNEEAAKIKSLLNEESLKLRGIIQQQLLSACTKNEAELLICNYHISFTTMLGQAFDDLENLPVKKGPVIEIIQLVIQFIEDLISLIESRFVMYLSLDENVPKTYFRLRKKNFH